LSKIIDINKGRDKNNAEDNKYPIQNKMGFRWRESPSCSINIPMTNQDEITKKVSIRRDHFFFYTPPLSFP
jgi:hypothetical protein